MTESYEADSAAAPRMHSAQPLEILADELGAAAGRIERELRLKDEARAARFEARLAAIELAALKAEEQRDRHFNGILDLLEAKVNASIAKVKDGEPGRDGKDADIEPLSNEVGDFLSKANETISLDLETLRDAVEAKLAEVKDGKDGEPGRDGKDADIGPIREEMIQAWEKLKKDAENKVASVLDSVRNGKDGKDGEPGKDADIQPLIEKFGELENRIEDDFVKYQLEVDGNVNARLAKVQDGKDGKEGSPGKDGKDGKLPIAREWTNRVHYAGDVVRYRGATYQALTDTGTEPPSGDWGELASRGTDGRGFVLRGTYDSSAEYKQHDIVMINRNSFAAKYDSPGECPGDGWQLFGPSGQRGKEGPPGGKGMDGKSVSILKCEADADAMVLRIVDSLGTAFVVDLEPIAERIVEAAR